MQAHLEIGFELDRRWHLLRGESMDDSKRPDLLALARALAIAQTPYAIIGGVALQIHQDEPRTTLDIDLAVKDVHDLPEGALLHAGFRPTGSFPHSFNWVGPGGTPVQFSDDPAFSDAIERATVSQLDDVALRVATPFDLLKAKLRAAQDPARRRSKRIQDLADAIGLTETRAELLGQLSDDDRALLDRAP